MNYENEIIVGVIGAVTTAAGWMLGGKQKSKRGDTQVLAEGAEKLLASSQGLLDYLTKERESSDKKESDCRVKLREMYHVQDKQEFKIKQLSRQLEKLSKKIG